MRQLQEDPFQRVSSTLQLHGIRTSCFTSESEFRHKYDTPSACYAHRSSSLLRYQLAKKGVLLHTSPHLRELSIPPSYLLARPVIRRAAQLLLGLMFYNVL